MSHHDPNEVLWLLLLPAAFLVGSVIWFWFMWRQEKRDRKKARESAEDFLRFGG